MQAAKPRTALRATTTAAARGGRLRSAPCTASHGRSLGRYGARVADVDPGAFAWLGGRLATDCVDHRRPRRPRRRGLLGRRRRPSRAELTCRPVRRRERRPGRRRPAPGRRWTGPVAHLDGPGGVRRGVHEVRAPDRRRRRLPGQPLPGARATTLPDRRRPRRRWPRCSRTATRRRTPGCRAARPRPGRRHAPRPSCSCGGDGDRRRVRADQGHRPTTADAAGEGPRRERDDRRPGPQRPRPGRASPAPSRSPHLLRASRSTPAWSTWSPPCAARCAPGAGWPELLAATFPPGSVTGAPKSTRAAAIIDDLEPAPRGPYCGAVGWVDADRRDGRARRRHPHVLGRPDGPRRRCASAPARASPGARTPSGSGPRPS